MRAITKAMLAAVEGEAMHAAPAAQVRAVAGRGMSAQVRGRELRLGSTRFMQELGA